MSHRICLVAPEYFGYGESYVRALTSRGHEVSPHLYGGYDAERTLLRRARDLAVFGILPRVRLADLGRALDRAFNRSVVSSVRRERPDVVLVVNGGILEPSVVHELSGLSTLVQWAYDSPYRFPNVVQTFGAYAVVGCFSRMDAARVQRDGYRSMYLPVGYDPLIFGPPTRLASSIRAPDVTFVGARYPVREALFSEITPAVELGIWGGDWKPKPWHARYYRRRTSLDHHCLGNADRRTANAIFQASKICLNIHGPWAGLNMRVFEIPGAGGFQLCDAKADLDEMFESGKEIETFRSASEALEKARFYLSHDAARRKIAEAGRRRARREHRIADRLSRLLAEV